MSRRSSEHNIAGRASEFTLLVVIILVLFERISAAQNNSAYEPDIRRKPASATQASFISRPLKTYHDRSIRDISAIGNRDVGCTHGLANRYSLQAQIEMGRSYARRVESTSKLVTDPIINEYVNRIGENLAPNSDVQVQHAFKIIDTEEVRAFSLPGGFIFVDSGLLLAADNEAELAAVISHEIAHVAACHVAQEMSRDDLSNVSSMPRIVRVLFRGAIESTVYLKSTRRFESEADFLGVQYLYKAGYDPQALPSFLEKVSLMEENRGTRANAMETYPQIADRIRRTQHEIDTLLPPASALKLDTSEFHEIRKRLADLKNTEQANKEHGGDGPRLKGASNSASAIESESSRIR